MNLQWNWAVLHLQNQLPTNQVNLAPQIPDVPSQDSDVLQRLEDFLQKMDDVSEEMRRMQQRFDELERVLQSQIPAEMPSHNRESLPQFMVATPAAINSSLSCTPLQEINLDSSVNLEDFSIPREHIISGLNGCRSRRNLMSRLTTRIFTAEERLSSNSRGLCGKRALNSIKLDAIHRVCLKHFPLDRLEQESHVQRDMRNAIDEACRKTKPESENVSYVLA